MGDRRALSKQERGDARKREVTLLQAEHLPVVARWCGLQTLDASRLRRNLVISGINLLAMRSPFRGMRLEWQIGDEACIEITGTCDPCSKMERELGTGAYNALRGHGGMTAMILVGGLIRTGDGVRLKAVHHVDAR